MSAPQRIYLQADEEGETFDDMRGTTWCADRINDNDIEYVRADALTEALNSRQRLARELLNHITGKSYSHDGTKLHAGYCLLCETETPPGEPLQHKPGCLTTEAEEAAK